MDVYDRTPIGGTVTEPMPPVPAGGADVRPEDGPQDVPQDPGSIVESEVDEEVTDDGDR